jgi:hypothetical protein
VVDTVIVAVHVHGNDTVIVIATRRRQFRYHPRTPFDNSDFCVRVEP